MFLNSFRTIYRYIHIKVICCRYNKRQIGWCCFGSFNIKWKKQVHDRIYYVWMKRIIFSNFLLFFFLPSKTQRKGEWNKNYFNVLSFHIWCIIKIGSKIWFFAYMCDQAKWSITLRYLLQARFLRWHKNFWQDFQFKTF